MPADGSAYPSIPVRVVILTLDAHVAGPAERARARLERDIPGLDLSLHAAAEWAENPGALDRAKADIAQGDIIVANMLFMEDHIRAVLPDLEARRPHCDAMIGCIAGAEVTRLTRMGDLDMTKPATGVIKLLKRLRGKKAGQPGKGSSGAGQMRMLRRLPKVLRYIPGKAQDLRAYFLTMQYWLAGSDANVENLVRFLVDRYAAGPRAALKGALPVAAPEDYPDVGLYHPRLKERATDDPALIPAPRPCRGTVGLLIMRAYMLAGDTAHYDAVMAALEARGLRVLPAFASGLDARPAIEQFFMEDGTATVDAVISLTGFSLVGGPAYNDAEAAEDLLARLDVPYIAAHALEFQRLEQWRASSQGLTPIEATMMVAIPEIDGATGPMVFGGRSEDADGSGGRTMKADAERVTMLADRAAKLIALRRKKKAERKLAVVLYGFPPNAGAIGTAAHLSVFESLFNTLIALRAESWTVDVPESVDALRKAVLEGNARLHGTEANVHTTVSADHIVRTEAHLAEIEAQWGTAPGRHQSNGREVFVLGAQFGNVFVGVQPAFGYEGDPMRLLFEGGFAPTHAFAAFYRWLREGYQADAVLHFGTHGALEFMPGKQAGMTAQCWPDRLIGDLPNVYLYAANNPSEGTLAKRRSAATMVSHLTPPLTSAGLYRGLLDLKASVERWRTTPPNDAGLHELEALIQAQAAEVDLAEPEPVWNGSAVVKIPNLWVRILELEQTLIPHGMHIVGQPPSEAEHADLLAAMTEAAGESLDENAMAEAARHLAEDSELPALMRALDGRFIRPVAGGDLLRTPAILPTGRNIHGFDPFRLPSAFAIRDGARQAERLIERHVAEGNGLPESVALVLWGTDNLKTEGGPIAQALALMGAKPRFDGYGRLCGAELIALDDLGRPRIDVVMTLSGIFRDLLPLQTRMLAEAAWLAATADEPADRNHVRAHALAYAERHGCDIDTAALRVFSNADGAYGSNVNHLIDSGAWADEDELADSFERRKCFAYGRDGKPAQKAELLQTMLADVSLAYQNLDSVEIGVTTVDHYFDTLGGVGRAVRRARGADTPVYIGDQTRGEGKVRTLTEQVALETRTRALNPKWYEGMLRHGHEGVRQIEAHVTNTVGWSATTGAVDPWVYQRLSETFVLDPEMRRRLSELNPVASSRMANRLLEAHERQYWTPDAETLDALRSAGDELEDRLEGIV